MRIIYLKTYYVWLKTLELKCVLYVKHMGNYVLHIIIPHTESTKSPQKYISIGQYLLPFNVSLYIHTAVHRDANSPTGNDPRGIGEW